MRSARRRTAALPCPRFPEAEALADGPVARILPRATRFRKVDIGQRRRSNDIRERDGPVVGTMDQALTGDPHERSAGMDVGQTGSFSDPLLGDGKRESRPVGASGRLEAGADFEPGIGDTVRGTALVKPLKKPGRPRLRDGVRGRQKFAQPGGSYLRPVRHSRRSCEGPDIAECLDGATGEGHEFGPDQRETPRSITSRICVLPPGRVFDRPIQPSGRREECIAGSPFAAKTVPFRALLALTAWNPTSRSARRSCARTREFRGECRVDHRRFSRHPDFEGLAGYRLNCAANDRTMRGAASSSIFDTGSL